jgi:hypothetical protein
LWHTPFKIILCECAEKQWKTFWQQDLTGTERSLYCVLCIPKDVLYNLDLPARKMRSQMSYTLVTCLQNRIECKFLGLRNPVVSFKNLPFPNDLEHYNLQLAMKWVRGQSSVNLLAINCSSWFFLFDLCITIEEGGGLIKKDVLYRFWGWSADFVYTIVYITQS